MAAKAKATKAATPKAPQAPIGRSMPKTAFHRAEKGLTAGGWRPQLRETREDVEVGWQLAAARSIDLIQNSGFIAGMVDQAVINVVGNGLRLKAKPDTDRLGWDAKKGNDWARTVQRRFELWSRNAIECDAEGRKNFGHLQAVAFRHFIAMGEILALSKWVKRPYAEYGTKVAIIPSHRLDPASDGDRIIQGVQVDSNGAPVAYYFKKKTAIGFEDTTRVLARDRMGRSAVVHTFDGFAGQVRGISPLTPVLNTAKQFDQLANATLTSAIIQAVFAATIKSSAPTKEFLEALQSPLEAASGTTVPFETYLDGREGWYDKTHIDLGVAGRFAHLFPNEELQFHETKQMGSNYEAFAGFLLKEIARNLGLTFESATGDYSDASYSSVRMATSDIFGVTLYRRANIVAPFCQAFYENWLEEEIEKGGIPLEGGIAEFHDKRAALCRADWKGGGKPQADDLKTAKALETLKRLGVMTDEMIADELGVEIEDVYEIRSREQEMRKEYGLPEPILQTSQGATADPAEQANVT